MSGVPPVFPLGGRRQETGYRIQEAGDRRRFQNVSFNVQNIPPRPFGPPPSAWDKRPVAYLCCHPLEGAEGEDEKPLNNTSSCHSGLDPESRKHLITLDTGLRRYDDVDGFFMTTTPHRRGTKKPGNGGKNRDQKIISDVRT